MSTTILSQSLPERQAYHFLNWQHTEKINKYQNVSCKQHKINRSRHTNIMCSLLHSIFPHCLGLRRIKGETAVARETTVSTDFTKLSVTMPFRARSVSWFNRREIFWDRLSNKIMSTSTYCNQRNKGLLTLSSGLSYPVLSLGNQLHPRQEQSHQ